MIDGVILALKVPQEAATFQTLVVPGEVLDTVEGAAVELMGENLQGTARWISREASRSLDFAAILPGKPHELPECPESFATISHLFLSALHECGRIAKQEPTRFALNRIQVNGKAGSVVATDGKSALIWKAFHFPFAESLLIPAIPLFGCKQIAATEVGIRRTTDHLVISAGIWTVWLPIDTSGRFPDVASIVPSARGATIHGIDPHDAMELAAKIPDLPDRDGIGSVAVDTHDGVVVRAGSPSAGGAHEIRLPRSRSTHPPVRIAIDRRHLSRFLALGCLSLRLAPGKPMVAESADRTFVAVTIDSSTDVAPQNVVSNTLPRRMLPVQANGLKGHVLPPRPEATGNDPVILDPLAEAEGLRAALVDAVDKAARLIQSLKRFRRQRRVLQSVRSSFQSLVQSKGGDV